MVRMCLQRYQGSRKPLRCFYEWTLVNASGHVHSVSTMIRTSNALQVPYRQHVRKGGKGLCFCGWKAATSPSARKRFVFAAKFLVNESICMYKYTRWGDNMKQHCHHIHLATTG